MTEQITIKATKKHKGGRPLTPESVMNQVLLNIKNGMSMDSACIVAGVGPRTFYTWKAKGEQGAARFQQFRQCLEAALLEAKGKLESVAYQAALADPKIALAILERRYPLEWGRRQPLENSYGQGNTSINVIITKDTEQDQGEAAPAPLPASVELDTEDEDE